MRGGLAFFMLLLPSTASLAAASDCYSILKDESRKMPHVDKISSFTKGELIMRINYFAISGICLITSGCASITQGTSQVLMFNIEPKEARCIVTRVDDGQIGVVTQSQNTLQVSKDKDDIIVNCRAEGYKPYTTKIASSASGAGVAGAVFIDLGIVDFATGAMWKYPEQHNISLEKENTAKSSQTSDVAKNEEQTK